MKISVLSNLFLRFPLEKAFEMVSNAGFDGLELCGIRPHAYAYDMDEKRCGEILGFKEKYQLEIPMYSPELLQYPYNLSSPYKQEREDTVDYVCRCIETAKAVETTRVQLTCGHAGYFTDRKENIRNTTEALKRVAEHAEKYGIDLIVEPLTIMESNTVVMLDTLVDIMNEIGSPNIKSMIDSAMVMTNWEPVDTYFHKLGDKLDYIHWGDSLGIAENHMLIGTGMIEAESFFKIVHQHGYDGWVSIELFGKFTREPEMHASHQQRVLRDIISAYN